MRVYKRVDHALRNGDEYKCMQASKREPKRREHLSKTTGTGKGGAERMEQECCAPRSRSLYHSKSSGGVMGESSLQSLLLHLDGSLDQSFNEPKLFDSSFRSSGSHSYAVPFMVYTPETRHGRRQGFAGIKPHILSRLANKMQKYSVSFALSIIHVVLYITLRGPMVYQDQVLLVQ